MSDNQEMARPCETCGQPIANPEDGCAEWIAWPAQNDRRELRVVHLLAESPLRNQRPSGCQFDPDVEGVQGAELIAYLLLGDLARGGRAIRPIYSKDEQINRTEETVSMIQQLSAYLTQTDMQ